MARVFITGTTTGIGAEAARQLTAAGHEVLHHARDVSKPSPQPTVIGDLESMAQTRALAEAAAGYGPFDAVIHNAGVYETGAARRPVTVDGLERTFAVNVVAPYLLTALIPRPSRLVYLTSGLHESGHPDFTDLQWERRQYRWMQAYADSKLCVTAIAMALAARHPRLHVNAVDPGWVRSRMGGRGAPVPLAEGAAVPVRLAVGADGVTGAYLSGGRPQPPHPDAANPSFQAAVFAACQELTGTSL
jgi:NAD(P)-dependent dehydrogenase (short-subunit alcohol dehydrogenase family)